MGSYKPKDLVLKESEMLGLGITAGDIIQETPSLAVLCALTEGALASLAAEGSGPSCPPGAPLGCPVA